MIFTLDQKKAHDPRRHISITANAGSGKTRVLVGRYCDLVEIFGAMPEKIAAITFTEKAASELRGKIAGEFERRLADDEHRASWWQLKRARERFPSAIVSTIHGFCAQLLREFPIEIGVAPNFGVTSGYERRRMLDDAMMDGIENALDERSPAFETVYGLARRIGRERMETILRMMVHRREMITFSRGNGVLALGREATVERWMHAVEETLCGALHDPRVHAAVDEMARLMKPEPAASALQALADLAAARSADDLLPRAAALRALLLTNDGTARKRSYSLKGEDFGMLDGAVATLNAAFKRIARFAETSGDRALHRELFDDTHTLLAIYDDILQRYEDRKTRQNVLDFEDLQLKLLKALEGEELRGLIRERFTHIMIDEFQDTNELQYAIARRILSELDEGHLAIVGDTKQAIYGFRNADVEVFAKAGQDISRANERLARTNGPLWFRREELTPGDDDERRGLVKLAASFRLLPSICAYVNEACAPLLVRRPGAAFGVDYEPLVSARRSAGHGCVEAIVAQPAEDADDTDAHVIDAAEDTAATEATEEAELIARRIAALVRNGEPVVWETPRGAAAEEARAAHYGDIAILCRKRSLFGAIEAALRRHAVPFATYGGAGFYRTQEIYDMLNYLRALVNARDDIALLGVLRSPFFGVSDAEIYRLTLRVGPSGRNLWSRAVDHVRSGSAEGPMVRAVAMIEDDRAMAGRMPPSLLLRRAIERSGWRGAVIGAERGEQNLANVDKLLELAREYENRGFTNLFDFVERVSEMVDSEEMEAEAPLNTGRDAVHLMTMHASKGLEFPVVILPSLHTPVRISGEPFFDKDLGFSWTWRFNRDEFRPAVTALMGVRGAERERAEEARLFYVAATRARDMLILSGESGRSEPQTGTMLAWALAPFGEIPPENRTVALHTDSLRILEEDGVTVRSVPWEQDVHIMRTVAEPGDDGAASAAPQAFRSEAIRIGELPAHASGEIYSATQFLVHDQCPTKYYLKYRLGIPEELGSSYEANAVESSVVDSKAVDAGAADAGATVTVEADTDDGMLFARLFRAAAMRLDSAVDYETRSLILDASGRAVGLERIIREALALEPMVPQQEAQMRERLHRTLERLMASDAARDLLFPVDGRSWTNHQLSMPFGTEFVRGVIDRVVESADGTLMAVQYKTRRIDRAALEIARAQSQMQLRIYARLIATLRPAQRTITCSILFTEHPDLPQSTTFSAFETQRIEEGMRAAIGDIRAITYSGGRVLPTSTPHCPQCAYWIEGRCFLERAQHA